MSRSSPERSADRTASDTFANVARTPAKQRIRRLAPLSVRLSDAERAELAKAADGQSLNSYVKDQLFGKSGKASRARRRPVKDQVALARALGLLGQMDLGPSLRTLSKAAESGALEVTPEVEDELRAACAAVLAMRAELLRALGYPNGDIP